MKHLDFLCQNMHIYINNKMRESNDLPHALELRINQFAQSLPSNPEQKQKIIQKYSQWKGYQFLNPKSKLYKRFTNKYNSAVDQRARRIAMDNQLKMVAEGNIDSLSVGAMCENVKQNLRKGADPYEPAPGQQFQQQFIFQRDEQLFNKTVKILHDIHLARLQQKNQNIQSTENIPVAEKPVDKISQFRKQMTVKEDGSMGVWGGKKYEGLGSQNEFTSFRREQSMNYYQNTHHQGLDRKKP